MVSQRQPFRSGEAALGPGRFPSASLVSLNTHPLLVASFHTFQHHTIADLKSQLRFILMNLMPHELLINIPMTCLVKMRTRSPTRQLRVES
jgi:hypothetical protein